MARIRTIKPEFWKHEDLSELKSDTHMLAASLLNYADDEGYFNANEKLITAECCPLRDLSVTIHGSITSLCEIGYIRIGHSKDGKRYGHIINFLEHQVINRPKASKIKDLDVVWDSSVNSHGLISDESHPEGKGMEGKGTGETAPVLFSDKDSDKPEYPEEFETIWKVLPTRTGGAGSKKRCLKFFTKATKEVSPENILSKAQAYANDQKGKDPQYFKSKENWMRDVGDKQESEEKKGGNQWSSL